VSTNGTNKNTIVCPHCGQRFSVVMPKAQLFNDLTVSMAVAPHEKPIRCICGKRSIAVMKEVAISWVVLPITDEQAASMGDESMIIPAVLH